MDQFFGFEMIERILLINFVTFKLNALLNTQTHPQSTREMYIFYIYSIHFIVIYYFPSLIFSQFKMSKCKHITSKMAFLSFAVRRERTQTRTNSLLLFLLLFALRCYTVFYLFSFFLLSKKINQINVYRG